MVYKRGHFQPLIYISNEVLNYYICKWGKGDSIHAIKLLPNKGFRIKSNRSSSLLV